MKTKIDKNTKKRRRRCRKKTRKKSVVFGVIAKTKTQERLYQEKCLHRVRITITILDRTSIDGNKQNRKEVNRQSNATERD